MSTWQTIDAAQLDEMKSTTNILVLDMREMQSYLLDHYPLALHLDSSNLSRLLKTTNKDVSILIYCYHGIASQEMAQLFADFGFNNVYSLEGGYEAWINYLELGFQGEGLQEKKYFKVKNSDAPRDMQWTTTASLA